MGIKRRAEDDATNQSNGSDGLHPSRKRRIEYTETDAQLASLYNNLSDEVKTVRLKAAAELVRTLAKSSDHIFDRSLTRLIKGLCSSRKAARSGFFIALTEVLRLIPKIKTESAEDVDLSIDGIIKKIKTLSQSDVKASGQVRRSTSNFTLHL